MGRFSCFHGVNNEAVDCFSWLRSDHEGTRKAIKFTFQEIATATNNFSDESIVGEGSFGPVHRGILEKTGQLIAVKRMCSYGSQARLWEFDDRVNVLSRLRHPNLVTLIGSCAGGGMRHLVYEFMPLGSLESRLHGVRRSSEVLDWNTRLKIAADVAKGLSFLHNENDPPIIYRDLKSSHILLDDDFHAKLSDFGLAKFRPGYVESQASTPALPSRATRLRRVREGKGYGAPEYAQTGKYSTKTDIYSFGILMLELISGTKPAEKIDRYKKTHVLIDLARGLITRPDNRLYSLADPNIGRDFPESSLLRAVQVAMTCLDDHPISRPNMRNVMVALNHLVYSQEVVDHRRITTSEEEEEEEEEKTKMVRKPRQRMLESKLLKVVLSAVGKEVGTAERRRQRQRRGKIVLTEMSFSSTEESSSDFISL